MVWGDVGCYLRWSVVWYGVLLEVKCGMGVA